MQVQKLINSLSQDIENKSDNDTYFRTLRDKLLKEPYCINLNWKDNRYQVSFNRKQSDFSKPEVRESYGLILEKDNTTPLAYSYNAIMEYHETMREKFSTNWNEYQVQSIIDGAVIRLYNYNGTWYKSTLRSIDANDATWHSRKKSFSQMFDEAAIEMKFDYSNLNPKHCYTFILCHPDNHMIINYEKPHFWHLRTISFENDVPVEVVNDKIQNVPSVPSHSFESITDLEKSMNLENQLPLTSESLLGYVITNTNTHDKIIYRHNSYIEARKLKGNTTHINSRIMELMYSDYTQQSNLIEKYLEYFPYSNVSFEKMNNRIDFLSGIICSLYHKLYLKNEQVKRTKQLTRFDYHLLEELNFMRLEGAHINKKTVNEYLKTLSPRRLSGYLQINYLNRKFYTNNKENCFVSEFIISKRAK